MEHDSPQEDIQPLLLTTYRFSKLFKCNRNTIRARIEKANISPTHEERGGRKYYHLEDLKKVYLEDGEGGSTRRATNLTFSEDGTPNDFSLALRHEQWRKLKAKADQLEAELEEKKQMLVAVDEYQDHLRVFVLALTRRIEGFPMTELEKNECHNELKALKDCDLREEAKKWYAERQSGKR